MSFIYLIVEAGGQQTEQGFKEWVGGWVEATSSVSAALSEAAVEVGELFGVFLAGWPLFLGLEG